QGEVPGSRFFTAEALTEHGRIGGPIGDISEPDFRVRGKDAGVGVEITKLTSDTNVVTPAYCLETARAPTGGVPTVRVVHSEQGVIDDGQTNEDASPLAQVSGSVRGTNERLDLGPRRGD